MKIAIDFHIDGVAFAMCDVGIDIAGVVYIQVMSISFSQLTLTRTRTQCTTHTTHTTQTIHLALFVSFCRRQFFACLHEIQYKCKYFCRSVRLSVHLSVRPSASSSLCLSVCPYVRPSAVGRLSIYGRSQLVQSAGPVEAINKTEISKTDLQPRPPRSWRRQAEVA